MKKIIATAFVLAAATPALANDQLALSLGVEPGQYTLQQLVALKNASTQDGNGSRVNLENIGSLTDRSISNPVAFVPAAGD